MTLGLGIDTSFDDTALALVRDGKEILANLTVSQFADHEEFGGVIPERASRLHLQMIFPLLAEALSRNDLELEDIDYVSVSNQPGLMGSLLVGVTVGKALAMALQKPLIGVNHLEAHIHAGLMVHPELKYPFISLLISGANTIILDCLGHRDYRLMGATLDDAVGECIDKCGRFLGLPMPAGPAMQALALEGNKKAIRMPRPMKNKPDLAFSFSGLKTAVLYKLRDEPETSRADLAAGLLEAIADVLVTKTLSAAEQRERQTVLICGGAAANTQIREAFTKRGKKRGIETLWPPISLCTDNAAMVAGIAHEDYCRGQFSALDLAVKASVKWPKL